MFVHWDNNLRSVFCRQPAKQCAVLGFGKEEKLREMLESCKDDAILPYCAWSFIPKRIIHLVLKII